MALAACILLTLLTSQALASGFQVSPTRVQLDSDQRVMALTIRNTSERGVNIQVELMAWSQADDQDHYEPTSELLATPPIFSLEAGEQQIIRVGLRRPPERGKELTYRLFLQELPPPTPDGFNGLQIVMRMGIPVFVAPASGSASHDLDWQLQRSEDGVLRLSASNFGNGHAQVNGLTLHRNGREVTPAGMFYVLPGSSRGWAIEDHALSNQEHPVTLRANVSGEAFEAHLQAHQ